MKFQKIFFAVVQILLFGLFTGMASAGGHSVRIHDAWVREAPPATKVMAAYMTIHNMGDKTQTVTSAESPSFDRVEMHETVMRKGMAHMAPQDRLEIPAKSSLALKPGSYHLMLIGPHKRLSKGDVVQIFLHFASGEKLETKALVRKGGQGMTGDSHMNHSAH